MRILAVADEESKYYWDFYEKGKLQDIDLIIACGDLKAQYLSFLATFTNAPVLYVHGNHDTRYDTNPPEGCICIEDKIYIHEGVRILGLGGSMQYVPGRAHQYTEKAMAKRVRKLWLPLKFRKGFDILVTHAPALGVNDQEDLPHKGFKVFLTLMDKYAPQFMVHGHVHLTYSHNKKRETSYGNTRIVNAYEHCIIEIDTDHLSNKKK